MSTEDNQVVDSAETTTTDDLEVTDTSDASDSEAEVAETTQSSKQHSGETPEQRQARIKRQVERDAKKAGISIEEYLGLSGKKGHETSQEGSKEEVVDERYARLELKTEGITNKKAQDVVLEYARFKGIEPIEALKSPIVKAEIAELEKRASVPAPSKRTNAGATDSFEYWVAQAKKGNYPRHDKVMMEKLKKARIWTS